MNLLKTWLENRAISVVRIFALVKLVTKSWLRNFQGVFFVFILPAIFLLMTVELTRQSIDIFSTIIPGLLAQTAIAIGMISNNNLVLAYKESVVIKRIGITPLPKISFIIAIVVFSTILTIISGFFIFGLTELIYGTTNTLAGATPTAQNPAPRVSLNDSLPRYAGGWLLFILGYLTTIVLAISLGLVVASVSKNLPTALSLALIVYFPSLFLIGTSIPYSFVINSQSDPLRWISYIIPFRYAAQLMTMGWNDVNYFSAAVRPTQMIFGGETPASVSSYFFGENGTAQVPVFVSFIIPWVSAGAALTIAKVTWKWET